jgi:uncharacterized membrane protein
MTKKTRNLIGISLLGINVLALWDILQITEENLHLEYSVLSISILTTACYTIYKRKTK